MSSKIIKNIAVASSVFAITAMLPELAIAAGKFDIDAGVKAASDPIIKALEDHWGKAVLITGGASALLGEGDGKQRAIKAAIACGSAGAVVLALIAMLK